MQPAAVWVPPWQVTVAEPLTLQVPVQVMLQVPAVQATLEAAPTVWVHDLPKQVTLQPEPQVPVQVAPASQLKLQPEVELVQASNEQEVLAGQSQAVPVQMGMQPERAIAATRAKPAEKIFDMVRLLE
jgi:hypothetical protein